MGELDVSNVEEVKAQLADGLRANGQLTLDTAGLTFMDSQGLRMLIQLGRLADETGSTIQLTNCPPQVQLVLDVSVPNGIPGVKIIKNEE